jgi:hypothetical protein
MSKKHVACVVLIVVIAIVFQITMTINQRMQKMKGEAERAKNKVAATTNQLNIERNQLAGLKRSSQSLIDYLGIWQPYFRAVDSAQNAELKISLQVKEDNLVSLSQKYDVISNKGNSYIPQIMRSQLTFEDDYARLLNWLGQIEAKLPTLRTSRIRLVRGTGENDLKMDLVLEQPLARQK